MIKFLLIARYIVQAVFYVTLVWLVVELLIHIGEYGLKDLLTKLWEGGL